MLASVPCFVNVELRWAASPAGCGGRHLCTLQSQASSLGQSCFPHWGPSAPWVVVSSAAGGRGMYSVWFLLGASFKRLCWSP